VLQDRRQDDGDCAAIVGEFMCFTRQEHERGDTAGWRFEGPWHVRASGLEWAWFRREVDDGETTQQP
jgi:hypothetical protein